MSKATNVETVVAVVVTFNRHAKLRQTVNRLLAEPCDRIYVVDNGSTDGSREWLQTIDDPRLHSVLTDRNLGGAGGFEQGLRRAVAEVDPDWILMLDDDARPLPGCVARFRTVVRHGWDAVAGAVYLKDGSICELNRPTRNPFWHGRVWLQTCARAMVGRARGGFHVTDRAYTGGQHAIDATSFVGLFLSRRAIQRAGYPDGALFIYGDDVLYTLSLRKAGLRIGFLPELKFEHDPDAGARAQGVCAPLWKAYYAARNGVLVSRFAAGWLFLPAIAVVILRRLAEGRHHSNRRSYYRLLWRGLRDGFAGYLARPHAEITQIAMEPGDAPP